MEPQQDNQTPGQTTTPTMEAPAPPAATPTPAPEAPKPPTGGSAAPAAAKGEQKSKMWWYVLGAVVVLGIIVWFVTK